MLRHRPTVPEILLAAALLVSLSCNKPAEQPEQPEPLAGEAAAADAGDMPTGSAKTLPPGCEFVAVGATGRKWRVAPTAVRIELRSPDGLTEVSFMEDGAVEIRNHGLQQLRFGAAGGVDDVLRLELAKPAAE